MAINIKNREAERLLGQLARLTGKGKSELVLALVRRELEAQRRLKDLPNRSKKIRRLAARASRKLERQGRTDEELIGYDENGLPA